MTGAEGRRHTQRMLRAGSQVVGGVTPGKSGQTVDFEGASLPVFGTVADSIAATGADVSVVFVPPRFAKAAVLEAIDAGIGLVMVITEGIPVHDAAAFCSHAGATRFAAPAVRTPVVGYIAGFTAPEGKTMGHAGAIVSGSSGTAAAKKHALEAVGVQVGTTPSDTADLMRQIMKSLPEPAPATSTRQPGRVTRRGV